MSINVGDYVKEYIGYAKKPTATMVSRVLKRYFETKSRGKYAIGSGCCMPYPRQQWSNSRAYIITKDEAMQITAEHRAERRRKAISEQMNLALAAKLTDADCEIIESVIIKYKEQAMSIESALQAIDRAQLKKHYRPGEQARVGGLGMLDRIEAALNRTCKWTPLGDDFPGAYETSCGEAWQFGDGEIKDNKSTKFCLFCGGRIEEDK